MVVLWYSCSLFYFECISPFPFSSHISQGYEYACCYWFVIFRRRDSFLVRMTDCVYKYNCYHSLLRYLVTVIEKLMPSRYFSDGLSAAQADQVHIYMYIDVF